MRAWDLFSSEGYWADPIEDPGQRIRPALAPETGLVRWLPSDGTVATLSADNFEIKYNDHGFVRYLDVPGHVDLYVTDRRVVLVVPDVASETGTGTWVADVLTGGAASTARDLARYVGGRFGLREKFYAVAQVDYAALALVRYHQTRIWGARSILDIAAFTGDPAPRVLELFQTSLARQTDIAAVATDIFRRARQAQLRNEFQLLDARQLQEAKAANVMRSGDAFTGALGNSCVSLDVLHEHTGHVGRSGQVTATATEEDPDAQSAAPALPTSGWYRDPTATTSFRRRWWDGSAWTTRTDPTVDGDPSRTGATAQVLPEMPPPSRDRGADRTAKTVPAVDHIPVQPQVATSGWYADPAADVRWRRRWWDGQAWTLRTDPPVDLKVGTISPDISAEQLRLWRPPRSR